MKKSIIAIAMASSMATAAFADVSAQSGFYIGGSMGWSNPSTWSDASVAQAYFANSATSSTSGFSGGASVGYNFALSPTVLLGVELGYMYLGSTNYVLTGGLSGGNTVSSNEDATQALLTATYLAPSGFNVFAKVGGAQVEQSDFNSINVFQQGVLMPISVSINNAVLPAAAVGMGYMPNQNIDITLQYEELFGNSQGAVQSNINQVSSTNNIGSIGVFTLGVSYHFGQ